MEVMYICPPPPAKTLDMDTIMDTGFGLVTVLCDNEVVWMRGRSTRKVKSVERQARREHGRKWEIEFMGPLSDSTYERQGRDHWVLTKRGRGFA